jgi:hypothetical protein
MWHSCVRVKTTQKAELLLKKKCRTTFNLIKKAFANGQFIVDQSHSANLQRTGSFEAFIGFQYCVWKLKAKESGSS